MNDEELYRQVQNATHLTVYSPTTRKAPFRALFIEVLLPAASLFFCAFTTIVGFSVAAITTNLYAAIAGLSIAVGSLLAGILLVVQLRRWHQRMFITREYDLEPAGTEKPEEQRHLPVNGNGETRNVLFPRRPKTLDVGNSKFIMSGKNLDELKKRVQDGDWSIRRDTAGDLKGFNTLPDSITGSRYTECIYCLRESGYVAGSSNRAEWTEAGRAWLQDD